MDETISGKSPVGRRLTRIQKKELRFLVHRGRRVRIADEMTIGREKGNAIVVDDPLVSRVHCIVHRIRNSWYIEDAGSKNGTWINERRLLPGKSIRLEQRDIIKLGGRIVVELV
ncbi:MAG: FHA domain-containing protein [Spirochaetaceae bacterium]|nr:FHA domain-containing protein [Spirochaetaceae bacterium]